MAKALQGATNDPGDAGQGVNSTRYVALTGAYTDSGTTESDTQTTCRAAGTLSNLSANVSANSLSSATTTITSRVGSADAAQSVSITSGQTGLKTDATHSDSLSATDVYNAKQAVAAGGSGSITIKSFIAVFSATTNHAIVFGARELSKATPATASSTFYFMPCGGESNFDSTESDVQLQTDVAGSFKNFQFNITANGRGTTTTLKSRKNTADGAQSISVTSASTGLKEDTTNSDSLSANDLFNFSVTNGTGVGTITVTSYNGLFVNSTNSKNNVFIGFTAGSVASYVRTASATASFVFIIGAYISNDTTEASEKIQHTFTVQNSLFRLNVSANGYTGTATATSRKNGAAGAQSISIASGSTGLKTDSTNSDSLVGTDDYCYSLKDGTANTITLRWGSSLDDANPSNITSRPIFLRQAVNRASTY